MGTSKKPRIRRSDKPNVLDAHFKAILLCILAGTALVYTLRNPQYRTGSFNDDAIYVIGARDLFLPAAARSQLLKPDYPFPGLPLLLAPFARFVTTDWIVLESLTVVFTILLVYLAGTWSRKWLSAGESLAVAALLGFNPLVARLSGAVMAANYYAVAIVISYALIHDGLHRPKLKNALALGFIVGWGSLVRPEGAVLLVSILIPLAFYRQGRKLLSWMMIPLAGWALFAYYWFHMREFRGTEYVSDLTALTAYWRHHFVEGIAFSGELLKEFLNRALTPVALPSSSLTLHGPLILLFLGTMAIGFRSLWRQRSEERPLLMSAVIFCTLYSAVHLFWHALAPRYAIPLLPLFLLFLVRGVHDILLPLKQRRLLAQLAFVSLLMLYTYQNADAIRQTMQAPDPLNIPPWRSLAWLNDHTDQNTPIMSNIAPTIDLYIHRPATHGIFSNNFEYLLYRLMSDRLAYLIIRTGDFLAPGVGETQDPNITWHRMRLWADHYPRRFQQVFYDPAEQTVIYRITPDPRYLRAYPLFVSTVAHYRTDRNDSTGAAFRGFNECLAIDPELGSAYNFLGDIYMHREDLPDAAGAFTKAIELLPDDPQAMLNLETIYRMAGQTEPSQRFVQKALDVAAANGDSELWQANVQELRRDWDQKRGRLFLDAPNNP